MARIIELDIRNYRGIKDLSLKFGIEKSLICLIGRGDSGKTTILDAISSVLSPSWNLSFYDTDFYKCDHVEEISIRITLIDFPKKMLSENKYGLYVRAYNKSNGELHDDVAIDGMSDLLVPALTIELIVDGTLEPKWFVVNERDQENIKISATDRALLNCFMVSDYVDKHFSWNKGNPLYALLRSIEPTGSTEKNNVVIQSLREAKKKIDENDFSSLDEVTNRIKTEALELGLDISGASTTLDSRDLSIKDGRISLHEELVPFRLKGKGSKRLASIAIQSVLVRDGGIMLIDEIEHGLEPDRIKQTVRSLQQHHAGQVIITTHSRDAITELGAEPLLFLLKGKKTDSIEVRHFSEGDEELQKSIRACPEAFFAKKVIVCEGATEIGICRAMDKWRRQLGKEQMSFRDCAYVDGTGNNLVSRTREISGCMDVALFCDSDDTTVNAAKSTFDRVFDCENDMCIEEQVFKDLSWSGVTNLIDYVVNNHKNGDIQPIKQSVSDKYLLSDQFPEDWQNSDTQEMRKAIAGAATVKKKEWFKAVHHGEALGKIIFEHFDDLDESSKLKNSLSGLSSWVDEGSE